MAIVIRTRETPPDGWRYLEPMTGLWIEGDFEAELIERVVAHREYQRIEPFDPDNVRLIVHRQICSVAPPGVCRAEPGEDYQPFLDQARQLSKETVLAASHAALEWMKSKGELVSKKESQRRAALCRGCRLNRPSPSWVCATLCKTLDALVPEGRREAGLSICGVCQCVNSAKVLAPRAVIEASNAGRNLRFPDYCWQGMDSTNTENESKRA